MNETKHYAGIDLIRFTAALLVMFRHLAFSGWSHQGNPAALIVAPALGLQPPLFAHWLGSFGAVGVEIFFVISGLVIANSATKTTPMAFAKSRLYRLYPAVWIGATLSAACLLALGLSQHLLLSYLTAMLLIPAMGLSVYWTLGVEIVFYAAVFLWKLFLPGVALLRLAGVLMASSIIYILVQRGGWVSLSWVIAQPMLLGYGGFFALGILLWSAAEKTPSPRHIVLIALALALCVAVMMRHYHVALFSPLVATWLIAVLLIGLSVTKRGGSLPLPPPLAARLRTIGLMTYPLYLMHVELGGGCLHVLLRLGVSPALATGLAMLTAIAAAYAIVAYGEGPIRRALKRWVERAEDRFVPNRSAFAPLYRLPPPQNAINAPPSGR